MAREPQREVGDHPIIEQLERYGELKDRWPASKIEDVELFEDYEDFDRFYPDYDDEGMNDEE